MSANRRGVQLIWTDTYNAETAVTKYGFVINGTNPNDAKLPTATGQRVLGIAMDNAAIGEPVEVVIVGRYWLIDMDGSLNIDDEVCTGDGAAEYHKGIIATSSDIVVAIVEGSDEPSTADELVLVRVGTTTHIKA